MTAVLDREAEGAIAGQLPGPSAQLLVTVVARRDGELCQELPGRRVDGRGGVGPFVRVDSDHDHLLRASYAWRV